MGTSPGRPNLTDPCLRMFHSPFRHTAVSARPSPSCWAGTGVSPGSPYFDGTRPGRNHRPVTGDQAAGSMVPSPS